MQYYVINDTSSSLGLKSIVKKLLTWLSILSGRKMKINVVYINKSNISGQILPLWTMFEPSLYSLKTL